MSRTDVHPRPPAHQFDDAGQQREAATLGMWLFLATELLFFGGLFLAYAVYRYGYGDAFAAGGRRLSIPLGATNTVVLLTSSLTMALAVHAAEHGRRRTLVAMLAATLLLGAAFLGIKAFEYADKIRHHLLPGPNFVWTPAHDASPRDEPTRDEPAAANAGKNVGAKGAVGRHVEIYFSLYFAMTGVHALHMAIGLGVLLVLIVQSAAGRYAADYFTPVEMTGLYWHFVDVVWVFLFPLLYLVG